MRYKRLNVKRLGEVRIGGAHLASDATKRLASAAQLLVLTSRRLLLGDGNVCARDQNACWDSIVAYSA